MACEVASSDDDSHVSDGKSSGSGSEVVGKAEYGASSASLASLKISGAKAQLPVVNASVFLFQQSFQADASKSPMSYQPKVHTDSAGNFRIKEVRKGQWMIEINDGKGQSTANAFQVSGTGSRINLRTLIVNPSASLKYHIRTGLPKNTELKYSIYVLGTRFSLTGSSQKLSSQMDDLPAEVPLSIKFKLSEPYSWSKTFSVIQFPPGQVLHLDIDIPSLPGP
jgi:hypothetical protein